MCKGLSKFLLFVVFSLSCCFVSANVTHIPLSLQTRIRDKMPSGCLSDTRETQYTIRVLPDGSGNFIRSNNNSEDYLELPFNHLESIMYESNGTDYTIADKERGEYEDATYIFDVKKSTGGLLREVSQGIEKTPINFEVGSVVLKGIAGSDIVVFLTCDRLMVITSYNDKKDKDEL